MVDVVIAGALRTAVGTFGGSLKGISAVKLGEIVVKELLKRTALPSEEVDELIFGNVLQAGLGQNPARQVSIFSGIPEERPAYTVNMLCASGLKSINLAVQAIQAGEAEVIVAGGMENMSRAPYLSEETRWGARMGETVLKDEMILDGLWCAFNDYHMGVTAENIAQKYSISREEQDQFALRSQKRAYEAQKAGRFKEEIVPIEIKEKKRQFIFEDDEHLRPDTSLETLSKLKPAFVPEGTVTAGNSSGINDAAAAVLVMSRTKAEKLGLKPIALVRSTAESGVDPAFMGMGPVPATKKALAKAGLLLFDIDLIELNEAFAAQSLGVIKELNLDMDIVNVNGGAIALGHPIGASGARILVSLLYEMRRDGASLGLATLCVGGGQGAAIVVEII